MEIDSLIKGFDCRSRSERQDALDRISDLVNFRSISKCEVKPLTGLLLAIAEHEHDADLRDSAFNILSELTSIFPGLEADWSKVEKQLDALPERELEAALLVLGNTLDRGFLEQIRQYQCHPDEQVATAAAVAAEIISRSTRS